MFKSLRASLASTKKSSLTGSPIFFSAAIDEWKRPVVEMNGVERLALSKGDPTGPVRPRDDHDTDEDESVCESRKGSYAPGPKCWFASREGGRFQGRGVALLKEAE